MKLERKYYYPNTTQKPNIVFDVIMRIIGKEKPLAYIVLDAMIRKIYGWGKEEDNIANSQLVEMTGLSPDTVRDSIKYLIENKFIEQIVKGHGKTISRYRLLVNEYVANLAEESEKEEEFNQYRGSQQPSLEVANTNQSEKQSLPIPTLEVANTDLRGSQQPPLEVANSHLQNLISKPNNQNLKEKEKENEKIIEIENKNNLPSLSYMNLKDKFSEKLKEFGIEYIPNKNEYFAIDRFKNQNIPPERVLELVNQLVEVKRRYPKDKFYAGICFNLCDLHSYYAKIVNAYSLLTANKKPQKIEKVDNNEKTDLDKDAKFIVSYLEGKLSKGFPVTPLDKIPTQLQNNEIVINFYKKLGT